MLRALSRHARTLSLIGGFVFGSAGALWSFAVVDRLGGELRQLSDAKADLAAQVSNINRIAADYFIANQQGDLIFITAQRDQARRDVADLIYKGNMLDRATPVRNMIGALAIARVLDYRQTYDAYEKLNDEARAKLSFDTFARLKRVEREIIIKGQDRVPELMKALFEIERALNANGHAQQKTRAIGLLCSMAGGFLLLTANLIAERQKTTP